MRAIRSSRRARPARYSDSPASRPARTPVLRGPFPRRWNRNQAANARRPSRLRRPNGSPGFIAHWTSTEQKPSVRSVEAAEAELDGKRAHGSQGFLKYFKRSGEILGVDPGFPVKRLALGYAAVFQRKPIQKIDAAIGIRGPGWSGKRIERKPDISRLFERVSDRCSWLGHGETLLRFFRRPASSTTSTRYCCARYSRLRMRRAW